MSESFEDKRSGGPPDGVESAIRGKYEAFRELLGLNNECLDLIAKLQEDLQYVPPRADVVGGRVSAVFRKTEHAVEGLHRLTGRRTRKLLSTLRQQRAEVETSIAASQELVQRRFAARLSEIGREDIGETGDKAALLAEVKNNLGLPVPEGFVVTTEAYRRFFGLPFWKSIRDRVRSLDPADGDSLCRVSRELEEMVLADPLPAAVEVAVRERARSLPLGRSGLAVRSSAVGEGGKHSFAGQFLSLLNVPPRDAARAYKEVIASRFSERALHYRLSNGLLEVDSPMAVLFMETIQAKASGILYTRDPSDPRKQKVLISATLGFGRDSASGRAPADLFILSGGQNTLRIEERHIAAKESRLMLQDGGGLADSPVPSGEALDPGLEEADLLRLAGWGLSIEEHFGAPQDVEWALDFSGQLWILQARPLALAQAVRSGKKAPRGEAPLAEGGRTVFPGRAAGPAFAAQSSEAFANVPEGAVLFLRQPTPEMVKVFPKISALVAEGGNITGHGAALLREFKIPSVFQMEGAAAQVSSGRMVSLDAVQGRIYEGALWPVSPTGQRPAAAALPEPGDPISRRMLTLHLLDPGAFNFRPGGCRSVHDILRYIHEKAIDSMFGINDAAVHVHKEASRKLASPIPVNLYVLDLGGGVRAGDPDSGEILPQDIVSRPFTCFWRGVSHPQVAWRRGRAPSLKGLASVMAGAFSSQAAPGRRLGECSYLLVAGEYMNLNSRMAYHFSLVDACVSESSNNNYVTFRFAGGGATRRRRDLRAGFIEACLEHFGFQVDRRGDIVNAWYRKGHAEDVGEKLDVLGRLMACSSQLDMYMSGEDAMRWYIRQFIAGNYHFRPDGKESPAT
jgi:pyruvate, water dikinase